MKHVASLLCGLCLFATVAAQADPRVWGDQGIAVRQGDHLKWYQGMARDDYGNTLLVWTEKSTGQRDVRAQLINPSGQPQWITGGVNVSPEVHFQDRPVAVAVNGGWIVAWVDFRDTTGCGNYWDYYVCASVYAQKLDHFGNRLWPANDFTGAMVSPNVAGIDKFSLRATADAAGGAIIAWSEYDGEYGVHAQRINGNGTVAWPQTVDIPDSGYVNRIRVAEGADGSMLMSLTSYEDEGVRVIRIMPDGSLPWGGSGVQVSGDWYVYEAGVASDGENGCYVIWADNRSASWRAYAQHVTGEGIPTWAVHGIPISAEGHEASRPNLSLSNSGGQADGMLAVWTQQELPEQFAVYVQKITPEGTAAWPAGGLSLANLGTSYWDSSPAVTTDYNGGAVAIWQDNSGSMPHCYASRVRWNGTPAWGNNPVPAGNPMAPSANSYDRLPLFGIAGSFGTYFVAYVGVDSLGLEGVRYQLLDHANGTRLLGPSGMAVGSGVGGDASITHLAPMGNQRTAVFWVDARYGNSSGWYSPLFYQIVDAGGQMERAANGERLVPNNSGSPYLAQYGTQTCDDGAGGLFVTYADGRSGESQIRVSHISVAGHVVGPDSGAVVWWQPGFMSQYDALVCPDGQGGCYVSWAGYNPDYSQHVFVMRLNGDLQRMWNHPVQLTDSMGGYLGALVGGYADCCIAIWISGNYSNRDIEAAGVCGDGTVEWEATVCQAPGHQASVVAVADGYGGAYVAWADQRTAQNESDIYAQRIGSNGAPNWAANGVAVYSGTGQQGDPQVTRDSGGALCVTWADEREHTYNPRIYAQRLSAQGTRMWNENGVRLNSTYSFSSQVAASERTGIFSIWGSYRSRLYATHVDSTGVLFNDPFWRPDTGGVVAEPTDEHDLVYQPYIVSDGWGGCVPGWTKWEPEYEYFPDRGGELYTSDVYVQRLFDYATAARGRQGALPEEYALHQNYPNPFNPATRIRFDLPQSGKVKLAVYDLLGREVSVLANAPLAAGTHDVTFDAGALPSGVYIYRLEAGDFQQARKLVLLR